MVYKLENIQGKAMFQKAADGGEKVTGGDQAWVPAAGVIGF